jgi:hypothetical protein
MKIKCRQLFFIGIFFLNLFVSPKGLGQINTIENSKTLCGYVYDNNNNPIADAYLIANSTIDSLYLSSTLTDNKGFFQFSQLSQKDFFISAYVLGYETKCITPDKNDTVLHIVLQEKVQNIDDVVVKAQRNLMKVDKGNIILNVSNSFLSTMPSLYEIMKFAPNVNMKEDQIEIIGRGSPLILIDGRETRSLSQVNLLDPGVVKSITINTQPSSKYGATYNSVIEIETVNFNTNNTSFNIYDNAAWGRKYNNDIGININNDLGKFQNYLSYQYLLRQPTDYSETEELNYLSNKILNNNYLDTMTHKRNAHNILLGSIYKINHNQVVDVQYYFFTVKNRPAYNSFLTSNSTDYDLPKEIIIDKNGKYISTDNIINLKYNINLDSLSSLTFFVDYAGKRVTDNNYIKEYETNNALDKTAFYKGCSNAYTANLNYNTVIANGYEFASGVKYSSLHNKNNSEFSNIDFSENDKEVNVIDEKTWAAFLTLKKNFSKLESEVGFRGEITNSILTDNGDKIFDQAKFYLFPSVNLNYRITENFIVNFNYASKINRQNFDELSPRITYLNAYAYSVGNPDLKPTIGHNNEFGLNVCRHIQINFRYSMYKDYKVWVATNDQTTPEVLKYTPINLNSINKLLLSCMYNNTFGKYRLNFNVILSKYNTTKSNLYNIVPSNKITGYGAVSNIFTFSPNVNLYCNINYSSKNYGIVTTETRTYDVSAGINTKILKVVSLTVAVEDIFNSRIGNWVDKYANIETKQDNNSDTRRFKIAIRYSFNNFKDTFKRNRNNQDELNRM